MLRRIKLSVDAVAINPGSTLSHTGTSYQVSTLPDFSNMIVNVVNSSTDLLEHRFEYAMTSNEPLYVRTKYHFNTGQASAWSSATQITNNQVGFKSSTTVVVTPTISVEFDYSSNSAGALRVTLDNTDLFSGGGTVVSGSWTISDLDGKVLYELPGALNVINELTVPLTSLGNASVVMVEAMTHTNNNVHSNPARVIVVLKDDTKSYINATLKNTLYRNARNCGLATDHTERFTSLDVRILDSVNAPVEMYNGLDVNVPTFYVGNLDLAGYYRVELRGVTTSGRYTPWETIYSGAVSDYDIRYYSDTATYNTSKIGFAQYIDFNGLSSQTVQADEDGVFYLAKPETNTVEAYRSNNGAVYPINKSFTVDLNNIPTINMINLYNGSYLLDHSVETSSGDLEVARFSMFNYNRYTKVMTPGLVLTRSDERYGTGRTGAAVATRDGLVYYVPGEIFDANDNQLDLEMRVYDIATNAITDHIPLPVTGLKENVSITEDKYGNLYMFGGSSGPVDNATHNQQVRDIINKKIYKFDFDTKTWVEMLLVPLTNNDSYRYKLQTLRNGMIFIIDVTPGIVDTGVRKSFIYNPYTNQIVNTITNNPSKEYIGITVELRNGDIMMMSSTADTVESVSYLTTTASTAVTDNQQLTASQSVSHLVVPQGDTVYIRDPYRYLSITIEGTSSANTGKVVWVRDNVTDTYTYTDLIVTRDMTIPEPPIGSPEPVYGKIAVVGDAVLTIL